MIWSLDGEWRLAVDPRNVGREEGWFDGPLPAAQPAKVPWVIQDTFPEYHGVAWYQREFEVPEDRGEDQRWLLRFEAVDYLADVWLNGVYLGGHETGEAPFELDTGEALRTSGPNRLTVRVLNPTNEPIDGVVLRQTPARNKRVPYVAGNCYNHGGIVGSVGLVVAPLVRVADVFVQADPADGTVRVRLDLDSVLAAPAARRIDIEVAPAAGGPVLAHAAWQGDCGPNQVIELELQVAEPHLWELSDPHLYRATARLTGGEASDEISTRFGFRDFRFADGAFRLNGRRLYLKCSHTGNACPVGFQFPVDPDWLRRDLLNVKVMGFNAIRFIAGVALPTQLDLCDELGLLVYEEHYGGWCLEDSPQMAERYDTALEGMIRRDRNHPSVVIWGLLNETTDGPVFRHAAACLPLVRELDPSRIVFLNSGRWDQRDGHQVAGVGTLSNPGAPGWEDTLDDTHPYQRVPHTARVIDFLRTTGLPERPLFLSEYGVGSAVDLSRATRWYERLGATQAEDAQFYRDKFDRFLADWDRWRLDECFAQPEDFFAQSHVQMAADRLYGLNAIRANPRIVGHSLTGTVDQGMSGEGLFTTFRELKPGTIDALFEAWAPLRLCLFAEPVQLFAGGTVRLEAVLANEDALPPGDYPVRLRVVGPGPTRLLDRTVTVTVAAGEGPFAQLVFDEELVLAGPAGDYRFCAVFERGGPAAGGEARFHVTDRTALPVIDWPVTLWGDDGQLAAQLAAQGLATQPFAADGAPDVVLVGAAGSAEPAAWEALTARVRAGATAIFLAPQVFARGDDPLGWLPLAERGRLATLRTWLYHKDEWAKEHPIFDGLPAGGLLDHLYYRELLGDLAFSGQEPPAVAVAGACDASFDYDSGLVLGVWRLGAGRVILNTLRIAEHLADHPVAQRLLRNLLRYAAGREG